MLRISLFNPDSDSPLYRQRYLQGRDLIESSARYEVDEDLVRDLMKKVILRKAIPKINFDDAFLKEIVDDSDS